MKFSPKIFLHLQNKLTFSLLTSFLSSVIVTTLIYNDGKIFSFGDNVYPLSSNVLYNYNLFFTNVNGGFPAVNNVLLTFMLFPFFNQYSEIIGFFIDSFIGGIPISFLIYKTLKRNTNSTLNYYHYLVTILAEVLLYTSINLYYIVAVLPATFFPIFASFPWTIYLIDSSINDKGKLDISLVKIVITEVTLITFIGLTPTLLIPAFSMLIVLFLAWLFLSDRTSKQKIILLSSVAILFAVLSGIFLLPAYLSLLHSVTSSTTIFVTNQKYFVSALKYYVNNTEGGIANVLTLSYYPKSIFKDINPVILYILLLNPILALLPFAIRKGVLQTLPIILSFLVLGGWLAAPYMFDWYLELYKTTPYLWSLDIPWLSFTYFLVLALSIALGIGLISISIERKLLKILVIILLGISVFSNFYISYSAVEPEKTQFPEYLYTISNVIDSSHIYNPRVLIYPLSYTYVAYNFSESSYVGAGFWPTLIQGNVYSSYYPAHSYSLELFMNFYPLINSTYLIPEINAMKLLGINYVILTKNIIPDRYSPPYNYQAIINLERYLQNYSILFNNTQMTLYKFSDEEIVSPVEYIVFVNISGPLWPSTSSGPIQYKLLLLQKALDINFVNYSKAAIIPMNYKNLVLQYLTNFTIFNIDTNITVIKVNTNAEALVSGSSPNDYKILLLTSSAEDNYVPLIIRYNYYTVYNKYYYGNYSDLVVIPGYSNQTYLLLVKPNSQITAIYFRYQQSLNYYRIIIYPLILILLSIYLFVR